jgi:DUF3072 family protein
VSWSWLDRLADLPRPGYARPPPARFGDAMTNSQQHPSKPTTKQTKYLKALAKRAGETFTPPETKAQASAEITRLKRRSVLTIAERRREAFEARRGVGGIPGDDASYRRIEVEGYGSTAHWRLRG